MIALGQIAEERDNDRPNSRGLEEHFPSMTSGAGVAAEVDIEEWLDPYPNLSVDSLEAMLNAQRIDNRQLKRATAIFEGEYEMQKAKELELGHNVDEIAQQLDSSLGSKKSRNSRRGVGARKRLSQRARTTTERAGPIPLAASQKATIVASHYQVIERETEAEMRRLKEQVEHLVANIDALEEDDKDLQHDNKKFDRFMLPHPVTHKISTETWKHYAIEKAKHLTGQIEGLRLRGHIAKNANRDATERLSSLGDMEGSITRVDFDQIKIRNEQFMAVLSQCNINLVKEKVKASHSDKTHNKFLEALRVVQVATDTLDSNKKDVLRMSRRLDREYTAVVEECEVNKHANKRLRKQLASWKVPSVQTYVFEQSRVDEIRKAIQAWKHRVQVAGFEVKKYKRAWSEVAKQSQFR